MDRVDATRDEEPETTTVEEGIWSFNGPGRAELWRQEESRFVPLSLNGSGSAPLREYLPTYGTVCEVCRAGLPGVFRYCPNCGNSVARPESGVTLPFDGWGADARGLPVLAADITLSEPADHDHRPTIHKVEMPAGEWIFLVAGTPLRAFALDVQSGMLCVEDRRQWAEAARLDTKPLPRVSFRAHVGADAFFFPGSGGLTRFPLPFTDAERVTSHGGAPAVGGVASLADPGDQGGGAVRCCAPVAAGDGLVRMVTLAVVGDQPATVGAPIAISGPACFGRPVRTSGGDWMWPGEAGFLWQSLSGQSGFTPWRAQEGASGCWRLPAYVGADGKVWQVLRHAGRGVWIWERMDIGLAAAEMHEVGAGWRVSSGYRAVRGNELFPAPWSDPAEGVRCEVPHGPHGLPLAGLPGGGLVLAGVSGEPRHRSRLVPLLTEGTAGVEAWLALWPGRGPVLPLHESISLRRLDQVTVFVSDGRLNFFDQSTGALTSFSVEFLK